MKELKTVGSAGVYTTGSLGKWHANLLRINRRKCMLNRIPMGAIKETYSIEELKALLSKLDQ
ncbi:MAG: hypothetical protein K9K88_14500 [Desulfobacterales bacterium]|nr:hypothetical protein [Desulfobacterales bacterium]